MISKKMNPLVQNNSVIRVMFEEGKRLAAIYVRKMFTISALETRMYRLHRRWRIPSWKL